MHTFTLNFSTAVAAERLWLALTDPKYTTKWDGNRWAQNDARVGGKMRARTEDGILAEAEILAYEPCTRLAVLPTLFNNPEEPEDGTFLARMEFTLEPQKEKTQLAMKVTGFPDEAKAAMMKNSWGGFYLEKIAKVAESIPAKEVEQFLHSLEEQNDFPGHVRHTELATAIR